MSVHVFMELNCWNAKVGSGDVGSGIFYEMIRSYLLSPDFQNENRTSKIWIHDQMGRWYGSHCTVERERRNNTNICILNYQKLEKWGSMSNFYMIFLLIIPSLVMWRSAFLKI